MEQQHDQGRVEMLGACDLSADDLATLVGKADVKPMALQLDMSTHCCDVPADVKTFANENAIRLLSHEDADGGGWNEIHFVSVTHCPRV
jgi:diketogulonate reductase-like aldo/keto reductase